MAIQLAARGGTRISLTAREYQLLEFVVRNKNRLQSGERIFDDGWSAAHAGSLRIVDAYGHLSAPQLDEGSGLKLIRTLARTVYGVA